jgi:hypothetical protein
MPKLSKILQDSLELTSALMEPGTTESTTCPMCSGGSSKDASFYITKLEDGVLLFICHRASCGLKGRIAPGSVGEVERKRPSAAKEKTKKELTVEKLLDLYLPTPPTEISKYAQDKYNIDLDYNFVRWTSAFSPSTPDSSPAGRIAIPIFDVYYELMGYDLKDILKTQNPKSLIMKKADYHGGAWYTVDYTNTPCLIVVEDLLSAIAVKSFGIDAVALLGTHITEDALEQINAQQYGTVLIALDNDALSVATRIATSGTIRNAQLLSLDKDIKDMSLEQRTTLLAPFKP